MIKKSSINFREKFYACHDLFANSITIMRLAFQQVVENIMIIGFMLSWKTLLFRYITLLLYFIERSKLLWQRGCRIFSCAYCEQSIESVYSHKTLNLSPEQVDYVGQSLKWGFVLFWCDFCKIFPRYLRTMLVRLKKIEKLVLWCNSV